MRVLIVEDERDLGDAFQEFIGQIGHEPTLTRSAEDALAHVVTDPPDLVLLDLYLPGMSGLDLLKDSRFQAAGVPVVVVSGVATETQAVESLRLGALDFLAKPVSLDRLADILAYLQPWAHSAGAAAPVARANRRRAPRAPMSLPVRIMAAESRATSIDLSPFGMKVRLDTPASPGSRVALLFTPADGGPPLRVGAILLRVDPDGQTFAFVNLPDADFRRLSALVRRGQAPPGAAR